MIVIMRCVFISRGGKGACLFTTKNKIPSSDKDIGRAKHLSVQTSANMEATKKTGSATMEADKH